MPQTNIDDAVNKRAAAIKRNNRQMIAFMIIFVAANLFFFTSRFTLPKVYKNITPTSVNTEFDLENKIVTFIAWNYSKEDRLFEILLKIDNLSLEIDPDIEFSCSCSNNSFPIVKVDKIIDNDLYVLSVEKVPQSFYTATLTVSSKDSYDKEVYCYIKMTDKAAGEVRKDKSDRSYLIYASNCRIRGWQDEIDELEKQQAELEEQINNSVSIISELNEEKKYQTEEEKEETDNRISKVSQETEVAIAELDDVTAQIDELKQKIKLQRQLKDKI